MVERNKIPERSLVYMTDVSGAEMDDTCGMRFWFNKMEGGKGILNKDSIIPQLLDGEIHNDLRSLSYMNDISAHAIQKIIDGVLAGITKEDRQDIRKMELLYRRLGWFAAFAMWIEPDIRAEFDTLPIDPALVLDKNPLFVVTYPDRLLRQKSKDGKGEIILREYIPMNHSFNQERWLQSWHYNIRLHVDLMAAQIGVKDPTMVPNYAQVVGLWRGYRSSLDNRLCHPYVWGYYNKSREEWTHEPSNRADGWELRPIWTFPGGIVAWVRMCGKATASSQFRSSPPVYLNKDMVDGWVGRRVHREREIESQKEAASKNRFIRGVFFGKITKECYSDEPCPYLNACWDRQQGVDPLQSGLYVPNNPLVMGEVR